MNMNEKSSKVIHSSVAGPESRAPSVDRLSAVLDRFRVRASLFHTGPLCGHLTFEERPGRAFLHVLRRGMLEVRHHPRQTPVDRLRITEPTLLFYPRPVHHEFINPPRDGSDFTCAALEFDGGVGNPIVQALPAVIAVPLAEVPGLHPALDLLFAEADQLRCGARLLADRLFEVVLIQLLRWLIDHPARAGIPQGLVTGLADPRLARALVAIHQAPAADWSLERLAEAAGMSRSSFASAFKEATATTPAAYVTDWRMSLAASMLRAGRPAKAVADALGFSGAPAFSKVFRQRFGVAPRQWLAGLASPESAV